MGTLNLPTMQAVFDHVVAHLRAQGRVAWGHSVTPHGTTQGGCSYRAANGDRCAVGCLIDSVRYRPEFEGHGLDGSLTDRPILDAVSQTLGRHLTIPEESLLVRLQKTHDSGTPHWETLLAEIAREFGLTFNPPVDVKA